MAQVSIEQSGAQQVATNKQDTGNKRICTTNIEGDYWHGVYGSFPIVIHEPTGYINMTRMCEIFNKHYFNWCRLKNSKDLMVNMVSVMAGEWAIPVQHLQVVIKGGSGENRQLLGGTFVHPTLIPRILSWADARFAANFSDRLNSMFGLRSGVKFVTVEKLVADANEKNGKKDSKKKVPET